MFQEVLIGLHYTQFCLSKNDGREKEKRVEEKLF